MKQFNERTGKMESISIRTYAKENAIANIFLHHGEPADEEEIKAELAHSCSLMMTDDEIRELAHLIRLGQVQWAEEK